jgi:hypothetical protein
VLDDHPHPLKQLIDGPTSDGRGLHLGELERAVGPHEEQARSQKRRGSSLPSRPAEA